MVVPSCNRLVILPPLHALKCEKMVIMLISPWYRLIAARFGNPGETVYQTDPRQMAVNKPRNIDDVNLTLIPYKPDLPLSQPTEMSYFLQRIRLAEISRSVADYNSAATSSSASLSYYAHVMTMDAEFEQMAREIPSFFNLDTYDDHSSPNNSGIFIQAYHLNTIMHTQRCKLHLSYLTSRPNKTSPAYESSWSACLKSARQINRAEKQIERSPHPFRVIRQRLSAVFYGAFMASIVLLMDACVNRDWVRGDEARRREAAEALRIVEETKSFSSVAASLYDSLTQILARYRIQSQQMEGMLCATPSTDNTAETDQGHSGLEAGALVGLSPAGSFPSMYGGAAVSGQLLDSDQLVQDLGQLMDIDGIQWEELLLGIDSSSFI